MAEAQGQGTAERIRALGAQAEGRVIELRRGFHAHPEVAWQERGTQAAVKAELDALGIPSEPIAGTGLVATIRGGAPGAYDAAGAPARRVALRADMDALPVAEQTGLPFASQNEGVMHACGHDCHMAMTLGAARILQELRGSLRGEVRLLFQPAEEIAGGAKRMIAEGAIEGVDAIFGEHVWSEVDAGRFSCEPGIRMANTDWFRIEVKGRAAHGSMPEQGVDAVVAASQIVCALQTIASRGVSPFDPVVVTVGRIEGGSARNVVADSALLEGTIRTWDEELRGQVARRAERIVQDTAAALGAQAAFTLESGNPALVNDPACAESARRAVVEVLGQDALASYRGTMSGEDFSEYAQRIPGVFVFVGTRNPAAGAVHPQHSDRYLVDEGVLAKGAMVAAQWVCDQLA